ISAYYFSRTDVARNWLGVITIAAFVVHWWMLHLFQRSIENFRNRLVWIYRTYFSEKERVGLDLRLEPRSYWYQPEVYIGLLAVSFVGAVLTVRCAVKYQNDNTPRKISTIEFGRLRAENDARQIIAHSGFDPDGLEAVQFKRSAAREELKPA